MHNQNPIQIDWEYRSDGRLPLELRQLSFETNIEKEVQFNGSSRVCQGLTEAVCFVEGPIRSRSLRPEDKDKCIRISCSESPTSSQKTRSGSRMSKTLTNFLDQARETFEANLLKDSYKNAVVNVSLTIVQNHGSLRCVILNAISLALMDAGIEMKDIVVSSSAGFVPQFPGVPVLDLSTSEEGKNKGMLVLGYSSSRDKVLLLEMKNGKLPVDEVFALTDVAVKGCKEIFGQLKDFLKRNYALKSMLSQPIKTTS